MIILQAKMEDTTAYKIGDEVGFFVGGHPIISTIIGLIFLSTLIYVTIKTVKKIRSFGE